MKYVKEIEFGKKIIIALSFLYLITLMVSALRWRIDTHHDGIMFLPAVLGKDNYLPQESLFYFYGIAQPFLEGMIFKVIPVTLINHRFIAFFLILLTGFFLYKIISLKLSKTISVFFSLTWLFANPTWANSIQSKPISIQIPWPNLWIQTFFITCVYMILRYQLRSLSTLTLVSTMASSLPFFRSQGLIYSICIILLVIIVDKTKLFRYLILSMMTTFAWFLLIEKNGGLLLYLTNTIKYPREYYSVFTSFDYFSNFLAHSTIYYLVCGITLLSYLYLVSFNFIKTGFWKKSVISLSLLLAVCILIQFEFNQWLKIFFDNSSAILLDSFILLAITQTVIVLLRINQTSKVFNKQKNGLVNFYGLASLSNVIFQYPLPDLGHRWWSSAILVLFMAEVYSFGSGQVFEVQKIRAKKALIFCCIVSICASGIQGLKFLSFERKNLELSTLQTYRGIQFPTSDQELINKFQTSLSMLEYIESLDVDVSYVCRDGLYYIRNSSYSAKTKNFLYSSGQERKVSDFVNDPSNRVTFYCNVNPENIKNLSEFKYFVIGKGNTDIFVLNDLGLYEQLNAYLEANKLA